MKIFHKKQPIWFLFIYALVIIIPDKLPAQEIVKNPHVSYDVKKENGNYCIAYTFKDQFGQLRKFYFEFPEHKTDKDISKFGIPKWLFETYKVTEESQAYRKQIMANGLFEVKDNIVEVDKKAFINYYCMDYCRPIAEQIVKSLTTYSKDNRSERIEMAIRFVQDIPYGIPEMANETTHFGGVNPPPKLLIEMLGDCDSKALLFTGILINLINSDEVIFLNQSHHLLTAILDKPGKGQTYVHYKRKKYLIAETAGPGERRLGQRGKYYSSKVRIEPLLIKTNEIIPIRNIH